MFRDLNETMCIFLPDYTGHLRIANTSTCWWRRVWVVSYGPFWETGQSHTQSASPCYLPITFQLFFAMCHLWLLSIPHLETLKTRNVCVHLCVSLVMEYSSPNSPEVPLRTPLQGSILGVWWRPLLTCIPKVSSTETSNQRTSYWITGAMPSWWRSEEHTSELQSR